MDPHSRFLQFNSRQPKSGPIASSSRYMDPVKPANPLDNFKRRPTPSRKSSTASISALYTSRPIATNSRVKQDEQYRNDMYLAFVNNALQQKTNGVSDAFDELVDQFNPRKSISSLASPTPQLRFWILALSHVVSRLDRPHFALVEAILSTPWTTMDTSFVKSYTAFIGMLVSAKPEYLSLVLGKIAQGLTYQSGFQALNAGPAEGSSSPITRRIVYDRVHFLLQHLISLVPTIPSAFQPFLVRNFPHKRQNLATQVTYIRNLLRITEYCSELSDRILATIVDRTIQIDVEIQVELEELEEQLANEGPNEVFELDPFDTLVGQEGEDTDSEDDDDEDGFSDLSSDAGGDIDDDDTPDVPSDFKQVQSMVDKLDAILKTIFDHFNRTHSSDPATSVGLSTPLSRSDSPLLPVEPLPPPSPSPVERGKLVRRQQFHTLMSIFDRTILRTFKSRYTQFLIFWYSSLDPEFSDLFQGTLVSKALLEEDQPAVTRAAAASYIASFVSRAQFVDRQSTRGVVALLCNFLRSRLDLFDAMMQTGAVLPSLAHHSVFYAVTQAVFLIFCFRWRDLLEDEEDVDEYASIGVPKKKWMVELDILQRVITSELNPLKVCSSNVVMQFARVAQATDFIYCYSILEANKRSDYAPASPAPTTAGPQLNARGPTIHLSMFGQSLTSELNTFFPFDPYKLPRSGSYIQGVYREWSSVAIDDDDEEEEEDEVEEVGEDEDDDAEQDAGPKGIVIAGVRRVAKDKEANDLGASFGGMSISPMYPSPLKATAS
ncbi:RNA polymerase I-specific transcription initiation factor RRN3 [Sparassis crispa]|uniref:RNA polymerase I-specific transcription initiation factor RRN3 n=1 Tax=Sparassis crispa TaxID=139825 RepID=A0A401GCJ8_9APHY|nr:RNA polymerase I-specific transcription initiation factor RRN3 [Sparassis crispa]GBE79882.1 RNA polymerase I-specific transcription initiation factor RRN3 [Sparassis crispa]